MASERHRQAWDRRTGETARAYAAFRVYLDLGPRRTYPQVAEVTDDREDVVRRWAMTHDWRIRAAAHDDHFQTIYWQSAADAAAEMGERHVKVAQAGLDAALAELTHVRRLQAARDKILDALPADPADDDKAQRSLRARASRPVLSTRDLSRLIAVSADLEHRVVVVEASGGSSLERELESATPDELRAELASLVGMTPEQLQEAGL